MVELSFLYKIFPDTLPDGAISFFICLKRVVFPEPEGPQSSMKSPSAIDKLIFEPQN